MKGRYNEYIRAGKMEDIVPKVGKKKNIITVKGVWPEEFENEDLAPRYNAKAEPDIAYSAIPAQFTDAASWKKHTTNLKCWYCDVVPSSWPRFIPRNPRRDDQNNDICDVEGNFHSWECAAKYIMTEIPACERIDLLSTLYLFESKFSGAIKNKIIEAPPKTKMKEYCGPDGITREQYENLIEQIQVKYCE